MVVCRTDLDEPLEEHLRLAVFPFPEILQDLVGLEEVFLVEQPDALVNRVQADWRLPCRHARTEERQRKITSATRGQTCLGLVDRFVRYTTVRQHTRTA